MEVCCRNCGGSIVYIPEKNVCYCSYCKKESNVNDIRINSNQKSNKNTCSDCGAELITEKNTLITKCAYCGSHQIVTSQFNGIFKPDLIIPFNYGIDSFLEKLRESAEHKGIIPDDFIKKIEIQELKGIYVPFRRSELHVKNNVRGEIICEVPDGKTDFHQPAYFDCDCEYDGTIIFDTSTKVKNIDAKSIGPFNLDQAIEFNPAFLCNFSAQIGDDNIAEVMADEIEQETYRLLKKRMPNYTYNAGTIDAEYSIKNEENILVPVWYFDYKYKGESYSCIMNGQTGKVIGNMPISKGKLMSKARSFMPIVSIPVAYCVYSITSNIWIAIATFIALELLTIVESKKLGESIISLNSDYSSRNLNSKATMKKYLYNYINTYSEYLEKYKDDDLNKLSINISDGKKFNYHNNKDKVYDIYRK